MAVRVGMGFDVHAFSDDPGRRPVLGVVHLEGNRGRAGRGGRPAPSAGPSPRRSIGGEQVEGRQAVRELLAAGTRPVRDVWVAEGLDPARVLREINDLAKRLRVPVRYVGRRALDAEARTDGPQGVLAHAQPLPEWDFD